MLALADPKGWSLKELIPPPLPDLREVNLQEVEVSVAALNPVLRCRVDFDLLPRELHYQLCLDDSSLDAARYFIQGRTGLPASALASACKLRLRESTVLDEQDKAQSIFELTVKSLKVSHGEKKRVACSEISVRLHEGEFQEWSSRHLVTGRLAKLRMRHDCGLAAGIDLPITAEIDHILGAGPSTPRPAIDFLTVKVIPTSPVAFNLIDFELAAVEHTVTVNIGVKPFDFLSGIAVDLSTKGIGKWSHKLRKGWLAREGITKELRKAEQKFLSALAA